MSTDVYRCKQLSRTVSARIPKELHEELRERCNIVGYSINDFLEASIEFALYGRSEFDFGDEEESKIKQESKPQEVQDPHEGKVPLLHFRWENDKLVQDETTWEERPKK
ncbi:MAG: hypothetical protein AUH25_02485 [Thaumarchaeota archaeon 13_1_40CM_38_12]|nr:MAG: hypothetical protein AUH25_02485 [Thaumarchaeota archaeon 13_1_40CM_38_12]OLE40226.1 MAG: hypothetical protein AUF74_00685 [Thaumarchaeota archaeon 13_1_20CM_2_38_5]